MDEASVIQGWIDQGLSEEEILARIDQGALLNPSTPPQSDLGAFAYGAGQGVSQAGKEVLWESGVRTGANLLGTAVSSIPWVGKPLSVGIKAAGAFGAQPVATGMTGPKSFTENLTDAFTDSNNLIDMGGAGLGALAGSSILPGPGTFVGGLVGGLARPALEYLFSDSPEESAEYARQMGASVTGPLTTSTMVNAPGVAVGIAQKVAPNIPVIKQIGDSFDATMDRNYPNKVAADKIIHENDINRNKEIVSALGVGNKTAESETNRLAQAFDGLDDGYNFVELFSDHKDLVVDPTTGQNLLTSADKSPTSRFHAFRARVQDKIQAVGDGLEKFIQTDPRLVDQKLPSNTRSIFARAGELFSESVVGARETAIIGADGNPLRTEGQKLPPQIYDFIDQVSTVAPNFAEYLSKEILHDAKTTKSGDVVDNVSKPALVEMVKELSILPIDNLYDAIRGKQQADVDGRAAGAFDPSKVASLEPQLERDKAIAKAAYKKRFYEDLINTAEQRGEVRIPDEYKAFNRDYSRLARLDEMVQRLEPQLEQANATKSTGSMNRGGTPLNSMFSGKRGVADAVSGMLTEDSPDSAKSRVGVDAVFGDTLNRISDAIFGSYKPNIRDSSYNSRDLAAGVGAGLAGAYAANAVGGPWAGLAGFGGGMMAGALGNKGFETSNNKTLPQALKDGLTPGETPYSTISTALSNRVDVPYNQSEVIPYDENPDLNENTKAVISSVVGDHRDFSRGLPRDPDAWDDKTLAYLAATLNSQDDILAVPAMELIKKFREAQRNQNPILKIKVLSDMESLIPDMFEPGEGFGGRLFSPGKQKEYLAFLSSAFQNGTIDSAFLAEQKARFSDSMDGTILPLRPPLNRTIRTARLNNGKNLYDY